jgi:DNA-binding transcriptional LysR family regulator
VPADSPLAARESPPTLRDVAELDLIGHKHCRQIKQLETAFRRPLDFVFLSDHNQTVQAMVATGVGHALVPRLTVDAEDHMTRVIELTGVPPRLISIAWHRDRYRSPAAQAFVETAEAVCAELGTEPVAA